MCGTRGVLCGSIVVAAASPEAQGNVGDACGWRRLLQGLYARAMPVHGAVGACRSYREESIAR